MTNHGLTYWCIYAWARRVSALAKYQHQAQKCINFNLSHFSSTDKHVVIYLIHTWQKQTNLLSFERNNTLNGFKILSKMISKTKWPVWQIHQSYARFKHAKVLCMLFGVQLYKTNVCLLLLLHILTGFNSDWLLLTHSVRIGSKNKNSRRYGSQVLLTDNRPLS